MRAGLVAGVEHAIGASATGLVVAGGGSTFPAGADITEFSKPHVPPSFAEVMAAFEDAPFPTAAAIHGTALGGGFELAMACHWRVMGERARVGLPEVHLGLLPGAGGTQRLPRLVGADAALEMMLTGAPIGAERALALGAVDVVVPEAGLEAAAVELVTTRAARRAHTVVVDGFRDAAKRAALEARAALPAPRAILRCVDAAVGSELAAGLEVEGREFQALKATPEARALQHLFFAERACAKVPGVDAKGAAPLDAVGVVGGGTMGRGIAMCFLDAGLPVTLVDVDDQAAAAAAAGIDATYRRSSAFKKGRLTEAALAAKLAKLAVASDVAALGGADLVVEAIYEDLEAKRAVFARLDGACPTAVLASNTSTLSIDKIADAVADPTRVVGTHFFSPANVMKLLENVRGARTGDAAVAAAMALGSVKIKILRRVRAESSRRPHRHRRDACSTAWRCEFLTARPSQDGRVVAEKRLSEELSGAPDALVDFHTGGGPPTASTRSKLGKLPSGTGTRTGASTMLLESTARWASLI